MSHASAATVDVDAVHESVTEVRMLTVDWLPSECCDMEAVQRCRDGRVGTKSGCDVGPLTTGAARAASAPGHLTWAASTLLAHLIPGSVANSS